MDDTLDDAWLANTSLDLDVADFNSWESQLTSELPPDKTQIQLPSTTSVAPSWELDQFLESAWAELQNTDDIFAPELSSIDATSNVSSSLDNELSPTNGEAKREIKSAPAKRDQRSHRVRKSKSSSAVPTKQSPGIIEKRYRVKIDDHLQELKAVVPLFRDREQSPTAADELLQKNPLTSGLKTTSKGSKASILAKAIEYIKHLEATCKSYESSNSLISGCTMS